MLKLKGFIDEAALSVMLGTLSLSGVYSVSNQTVLPIPVNLKDLIEGGITETRIEDERMPSLVTLTVKVMIDFEALEKVYNKIVFIITRQDVDGRDWVSDFFFDFDMIRASMHGIVDDSHIPLRLHKIDIGRSCTIRQYSDGSYGFSMVGQRGGYEVQFLVCMSQRQATIMAQKVLDIIEEPLLQQ